MSRLRLPLPIAMWALAVLACSLPAGGEADTALFRDDFSDSRSGWSTFTSDDSSVQYDGGAYVMKILIAEWFVWGNPGENTLSNIHIEVTANNPSRSPDTAFGIICSYQDESQYYYLGIDNQGGYAIAKATPGSDDIILTNDNRWRQSTQIAADLDSYRLGADCGDGALALYVDGKQIDSVRDASYTTGDVGLFAWSDQVAEAEIQFDDFVVTALAAP